MAAASVVVSHGLTCGNCGHRAKLRLCLGSSVISHEPGAASVENALAEPIAGYAPLAYRRSSRVLPSVIYEMDAEQEPKQLRRTYAVTWMSSYS